MFVFEGVSISNEEKQEAPLGNDPRANQEIGNKEKEKNIERKKKEGVLRIGWLTDVHLGINCHEEKLPTLADEVIEEVYPKFERANADFVAMTGDMVDDYHVKSDQVLNFHRKVKDMTGEYDLETYFTFGNHDVCKVSKEDVSEIYGMPDNKYSFKKGELTFIALDPQFNKDGTSYEKDRCFYKGYIPESQLEWLEEELSKAEGKVVVFSHQPLTKVGESVQDIEGVENADQVREILESSGKVEAVLSGHHQANKEEELKTVNGIKHFILHSPIFQKTRYSYAVIDIDSATGEIRVDRFMDENSEAVKAEFERKKDKYDGKDEEQDYKKIKQLKTQSPQEYQDLKEKYLSGKEISSFPEHVRQKIKDFEDYWNYQKYLDARKEFKGY